jgi:hypothetical protein
MCIPLLPVDYSIGLLRNFDHSQHPTNSYDRPLHLLAGCSSKRLISIEQEVHLERDMQGLQLT